MPIPMATVLADFSNLPAYVKEFHALAAEDLADNVFKAPEGEGGINAAYFTISEKDQLAYPSLSGASGLWLVYKEKEGKA